MLVTRVEEHATNTAMSRVGDEENRSAHNRLVVVALFVFNAALLYPAFFPSLNQINLWDQARDIDRGRKLVEGVLPTFASNPAVAGLYAFTYLPFARSPECIPRLASAAFMSLVQGYHWHFAVFCFVFVARGIIALLLGGSYLLLATLLFWPVSSLLNILIIFQGPHLLIPFVNMFALAAIGVTAAGQEPRQPARTARVGHRAARADSPWGGCVPACERFAAGAANAAGDVVAGLDGGAASPP